MLGSPGPRTTNLEDSNVTLFCKFWSGLGSERQRSGTGFSKNRNHESGKENQALSEETGLSRRDAPCSVFG